MSSRRSFLSRGVAAAASLAFAGPISSWGAQAQTRMSFDLHCHPGLFFAKGTPMYMGDDAVTKTISEMNAGGLTGAFIGLVADAPLIQLTPTGVKTSGAYAPGDAWKEYQRQMTMLKEMLRTRPVSFASHASDLDTALKTRKAAAFISCEGGDFLDGDAGKLEPMFADGVRSVQLVHYSPNALGDLQTEAPQHNGLSKEGKETVQRMNKLGMLIDVAHASFDTVKGVADSTEAPIMLSHSILKMEDSRPLARRAITPEHAKLVAGTGGLIGAWPSGFSASFEEFIDNTKRLVDVVGIDHVGLGTDMDGNFKPVISSYLQLGSWADALKSKGLSEGEVGKILGGNARRVLGKVIR